MPTLEELIDNYYNKEKTKKRDIHRLWASDVYSIRKGYLTINNFFTQKLVDKDGKSNIFWGQAGERQLDAILMEENADFMSQVSFEVKLGESLVLSGKTDFSFPQFILETKCPMVPVHEIPEKWKDQLECQHRASRKPVKLGVFYRDGNLLLKVFSYEPSEKRWAEIQLLLRNFHQKLVKRYGNGNPTGMSKVQAAKAVS